MELMEVFLVVAIITLIANLVLLATVGLGIWRLVTATTKLMATADSGLTTIKHKLLDPEVADDVDTAGMLTQGVLGITRVVFGGKKKKRHTK